MSSSLFLNLDALKEISLCVAVLCSPFKECAEKVALDVYSGGLAIETLRESMGKLSYEEEIDSFLFKLKY